MLRATAMIRSPRSGLANTHAHRVAALGRHPGDRRAHDLAALHDDEHLVVLAHDQRADQVTALLDDLGGLDAEAAAALDAVLRRPASAWRTRPR